MLVRAPRPKPKPRPEFDTIDRDHLPSHFGDSNDIKHHAGSPAPIKSPASDRTCPAGHKKDKIGQCRPVL